MTGAPTIGFAGMTHLGITSAVAAAARGFDVVGFDPDADEVARLKDGVLPVAEPGLDDALAANGDRLRFASDPAVLDGCAVIYVAPDVPTDDRGVSDSGLVTALVEAIAPGLRADQVLVVLSQVTPGFTRALGLPPRQLYYQVETLIFGQALDRALNPERFIIGCADPSVPLPDALAAFLAAFDCPVLPMRYESAELAKIAINCFLVSSVSMTNTLAELCEGIGADWREIAPALRLDRRIGPHAYLSPGLGIAGGNLERDLATVLSLGDAVGSDTGMVTAAVANSRHRKGWVLRELQRAGTDAAAPIGVLGIAYKKDTASIKNSPSVALMRALGRRPIRAHDPVAALPSDLDGGETVADPLAACDGVAALAVMTSWDAFKDIDPKAIAARMAGRLVLDPYGVLDGDGCRAAGLDYRTLGVAPSSESED